MMPLTTLSHRTLVIAAIAGITFFLSALILSQIYAHPLLRVAGASTHAGTVYLSPEAAAAASVPEEEVMREVHIANSGLVLLRGVRVVSVSGSTIRVTLAWGSSDFTWTLLTNSGTKFLTAGGEKQKLADIGIGDTITVTGSLNESGNESVIDTDFVRE